MGQLDGNEKEVVNSLFHNICSFVISLFCFCSFVTFALSSLALKYLIHSNVIIEIYYFFYFNSCWNSSLLLFWTVAPISSVLNSKIMHVCMTFMWFLSFIRPAVPKAQSLDPFFHEALFEYTLINSWPIIIMQSWIKRVKSLFKSL